MLGRIPPNVLFIAVDDLRPIGGAYGSPQVKTPHLDALAHRGLRFERAYCQQAVCSPSRTSLLTGRRPDTTRVYDLQTHFRLHLPEVVTLPQLFKQHDYHSQGLGKIFHVGLDDPQSWSVPHWLPAAKLYSSPAIRAALEAEAIRRGGAPPGAAPVLRRDPKTGTVLKVGNPKIKVRGPSWEAPDVPDEALQDGETATRAIATLRAVKDRPFFLAVGFLKPHLPFVAPKLYYDLYPPETIKLADNPFVPTDAPALALTDFSELRRYSDLPHGDEPVPDEKARELVRGYYAATSYTDAQIGRVLAELDRLGLRDNTIVVVWGDHGWQLGEHGLWCKHTNFEVAARAPLILSVPGRTDAGAETSALVEFVDLYPTLAELAGLPLPAGLEGTSLVPLLAKPDRPWKQAAFSQYPREDGRVMGYSLRTDRHRYTEWIEVSSGKALERELYDHAVDPAENANLARRPENLALAAALSRRLHAGWRAALPPPAPAPATSRPANDGPGAPPPARNGLRAR
ncbi:MAG: sulfatase [Opitutae bacterium]|nr:sulfatase [Opitutae bacterium]